MQDLKVWPGVEGDGRGQTKTPGKLADSNDTMARLAKLTKKHRKGHMLKVDWLDRLTFREIEMINEVSISSHLSLKFKMKLTHEWIKSLLLFLKSLRIVLMHIAF